MDEELIKKIINSREVQNLSQADLATKAGIERTALNKIEKGTRRISSDELKAIALALNISADQLLNLKVANAQHQLTFKDLGLDYQGFIPEDMLDVYRVLAKHYAEKHHLPKSI